MVIYCTSYCNQGHDLDTGKPVGHECRVIPPRALQLEREGDVEGAIAAMYEHDLEQEERRGRVGMRRRQ